MNLLFVKIVMSSMTRLAAAHVLLLALMGLSAVAQWANAQTGSSAAKTAKAATAPISLSALQDQPATVRDHLTHAVFYRPPQDAGTPPLRVYLSEAYHATLFAGTYAEVCAPSGGQTVSLMAVGSAAQLTEPVEMVLAAGQSHFVRVWQHTDGTARWQEVTADTARQEAGSAQPTIFQTRVRRAIDCRTAPADVAASTATNGSKAVLK